MTIQAIKRALTRAAKPATDPNVSQPGIHLDGINDALAGRPPDKHASVGAPAVHVPVTSAPTPLPAVLPPLPEVQIMSISDNGNV